MVDYTVAASTRLDLFPSCTSMVTLWVAVDHILLCNLDLRHVLTVTDVRGSASEPTICWSWCRQEDIETFSTVSMLVQLLVSHLYHLSRDLY